MSYASLPLPFWSHVFAIAVYLINHMPTPTLKSFISIRGNFWYCTELFETSDFRLFMVPWLCSYSSYKLDPRSKPCVFLGYSLTQSAYLCYHPPTSRIFISRHVKFVKSIFPFLTFSTQSPRPQPNTISTWIPPPINSFMCHSPHLWSSTSRTGPVWSSSGPHYHKTIVSHFISIVAKPHHPTNHVWTFYWIPN